MILYLFLNVKSVRVHKMENFAKFQSFFTVYPKDKGRICTRILVFTVFFLFFCENSA